MIKSQLSSKNRNQPCPCKSGLKQKHCHGDIKKLQTCNRVAQFYMSELIEEERKKRGLEPITIKGKDGSIISGELSEGAVCGERKNQSIILEA